MNDTSSPKTRPEEAADLIADGLYAMLQQSHAPNVRHDGTKLLARGVRLALEYIVAELRP